MCMTHEVAHAHMCSSRFTRPARVWTTHVSLESHDGVTSPNVPKRNAWNQPIKGIDDGTSRNLNSSLSTQQLEPTSQHKFTDALEWTSHVPTPWMWCPPDHPPQRSKPSQRL